MNIRFSSLFLILTLTAGSFGCNSIGDLFSNESEAVEVAEGYLDALKAKDWAKAKSMATEESETYIDMLESVKDEMPGMDSIQSITKKGSYKVVLVEYCCNQKGQPEVLEISNKSGEWKVHQTKFGGNMPLDPMSDEMFDDAALDDADMNGDEETPAVQPDEEFMPEQPSGK
ncbi:MAG: hypothetical protein O3C32_05235 [Bacteroidetes bacterium]|nr:hypothetical protein [Bacteroidota bacterium]